MIAKSRGARQEVRRLKDVRSRLSVLQVELGGISQFAQGHSPPEAWARIEQFWETVNSTNPSNTALVERSQCDRFVFVWLESRDPVHADSALTHALELQTHLFAKGLDDAVMGISSGEGLVSVSSAGPLRNGRLEFVGYPFDEAGELAVVASRDAVSVLASDEAIDASTHERRNWIVHDEITLMRGVLPRLVYRPRREL